MNKFFIRNKKISEKFAFSDIFSYLRKNVKIKLKYAPNN